MKALMTLLLIAGISSVATGQEDNSECLDKSFHIFTAMNGYYLEWCKETEFGKYEFYVDRGARSIEKKGKFREVWYRRKSDETRAVSGLQIHENYLSAIKAAGGVVVENSDETVYRTTYEGKELWIFVNANTNAKDQDNYGIMSVEVDVLKQEVSAHDIKGSIDTQGSIALYGIYFDTGKAAVKEESKKAINEVALYLKENPDVNIFVVGHTDNVGLYSDNLKLSKARGEAVKSYLVTHYQISPERLAGDGAGPLCPVTSNDTDEGKKMNRRVVVVKK